MNKYLQFYRLYSLWFTIASLISLWLFFSTGNIFIISLIKAAFYPAIFYLLKPFVKRYFYYFHNLGFAAGTLFRRIVIADFALFTVVIFIINFMKNAGN